jgi:hypothetical protein
MELFYFSGMFKKQGGDKCEFCPANTYSDGTLTECLKCNNDLSVLPGLYYKNWNELPIYLNRSYLSFDDTKNRMFIIFYSFDKNILFILVKQYVHSQSWVSINQLIYIVFDFIVLFLNRFQV